MSIIDHFKSLLGSEDVITEHSSMSGFLTEWRGEYVGDALCAVRPESTQEVQSVVKSCVERGIAIVPQGGNTGLCGGAIPEPGQVLILMDKMDQVRSIDKVNMSLSVDAGMPLKRLCKLAEEGGFFFPMRITPWDKCQIGGLISSNAGGLHTVYCGSMRNLVLGLEVVLGNGEIWNGMKALRKNNEGYDLKHFFIGAEGTLGIITGAVLKLMPPLTKKETVLFQCDSVEEVLATLKLCSHWENLLTFEVMNQLSLQLVQKHNLAKVNCGKWTVLAEFRNFLPHNLQDHSVSKTEAEEMHKARLNLSLAQKLEGNGVKSDVSIPISEIAPFIETADSRIRDLVPEFRSVVFGHFAEGNLHYNPMEAESGSGNFLEKREEIANIIQDEVVKRGGSITGEHGIGQKHVDFLSKTRKHEVSIMKKIKSALNPLGNFNPRKVTK